MKRPSFTGFVCPRCRYRVAERTGPLSVCPRDQFVLVDADVLAAADGDPLLGMIVSERFAVLGKIGRGATGTVYRALDLRNQRPIALKILRGDVLRDPRLRERIECEARVLSKLSSPHTVRLLDVGEFVFENVDEFAAPARSFFLAMAMLEGEPLSKRLVRQGKLSVDESIRWATHALHSLHEAHEKGIIHRDLTPNNLFLTRVNDHDEVGVVVDFGLAVFVQEVLPKGDSFETIGTPRYMSPEQARGGELDGRSDLYSVGLLLYQMLTGKPPFVDGDAARVMARHRSEVPLAITVVEPNAGIPPWLSELVARTLAKDPGARPQSAREFLVALGTSS